LFWEPEKEHEKRIQLL